MGQPDEEGFVLNGNSDRFSNVENAKDSSPWQKISNTGDIQKYSRNWTLAGDAGLLDYLQDFSQKLISRTHEIEKTVDQLIHETKVTSSRVNNTINDFLMLSNTQFIENRVYDEDVQTDAPTPQNKKDEQKTKDQREAEIIPQISTALSLGLEVIDKAFDKVELQDSDSEDEEGKTIHGEALLEPKDPYFHRPLPYIIGSEAFHTDDSVGLFDLVNAAEVESESDRKEYESDNESFSEESFEEADNIANEKAPIQKPIFNADLRGLNKLPRSSESESESSDLFGDEEEYVSGGGESEDYTKEEKVSSDIRSLSKKSIEIEDDTTSKDLFNDSIFGLNKPRESSSFVKRSSPPSKSSLFDSNEFEDPFDNASTEEDKEKFVTEKKPEIFQEKNVPEKKPNELKYKQSIIAQDLEGLFHSGDEDDLFTPHKVLEKSKKKDVKSEKSENNSLFDDDEDKLFSEPVTKSISAPKTTTDLFTDKDEFEEPSIISNIKPHDIKTATNTKPSASNLFLDDSSDATIPASSKLKEVTPSSLFLEDSIDVTSSIGTKPSANSLFLEDSQDDLFGIPTPPSKNIPSFDSPSSEIKPQKTNVITTSEAEKKNEEKQTKISKPSVFSLLDEEEDEDDLFDIPTKDSKTKNALKAEAKPRRGSSLFEDDDLFGKESRDSPDVNLFATSPKSNVNVKKEILESQRKLSDTALSGSFSQPKKPVGGVSLFGGIDIFGRSDNILPSPEKSIDKDESSIEELKNKSESKEESNISVKNEEKITEEASVGFDKPVDTSNTLSCAAKGRAKIQTRRRPPTRKGRQMMSAPSIDSTENETLPTPPTVVPSVDQVDNSIAVSKRLESVTPSEEQKELNVDVTSPSTEEDDIFIINDAVHDIFPAKDIKTSFTDSLFSDLEQNKSNSKVTDDIFGDDIFASTTKPKSSIHQQVLSTSPDDIFSDSFSKDSDSIFSTSTSRSQKSNKEDKFLYSESADDDIFSQTPVRPANTTVKKQTTMKKVKIESDIFDDPLLAFGQSDKD